MRHEWRVEVEGLGAPNAPASRNVGPGPDTPNQEHPEKPNPEPQHLPKLDPRTWPVLKMCGHFLE